MHDDAPGAELNQSLAGAVGSVRCDRDRDIKKAHAVFGSFLRIRAFEFIGNF